MTQVLVFLIGGAILLPNGTAANGVGPSSAVVNCSDPSQATPEACGVPGATTVVEKTFTASGKLLATTTFHGGSEDAVLGTPVTRNGRGKIARRGSGSGGASSASGCREVTVHNRRNSYLGALMYTWDTSTYWCWTRSSQNIYNVSTGSRFIPDTTTIDWQGVIDRQFLFYDYSANDGHPRSAYKNWQQGKVANVVLGATIGTIYPENLIRSYFNGTWVWETVE